MEDIVCDNDEACPCVGISACLLGHAVRFDGGHKGNRFLREMLAKHFEWVTVCPEVEMGLGTPREAIRLVQLDGETRLRGTRSGIDHTERMSSYIRRRIPP